MKPPPLRTLALALGALATGCTRSENVASHALAVSQNAASTIAGTWELDGDTPPPQANLPRFVRLRFGADGSLDASYVAAGGALASVIGTPSKRKHERDTYALGDGKTLRIVEGSRALTYTYDLSDGKLFLTGGGEASASVYHRTDG